MDLLIVSYHFPPDDAIGGIRPYQFARLLPQHGVETWVLTVYPAHAWKLNPEFQPEGVPVERIVRTPVHTSRGQRLQRLTNRIKALLAPKQGTGAKPRARVDYGAEVKRKPLLLACLLEALEYPDRHIGWYRPAMGAVRKLLRQVPVSAVFSTSPPRTSALIAYAIARQYGLPWIMDLRDPWVTYVEGWRSTIQCPIVRRMHQRAFSACLHRANAVTVNSPVLAEFIAREHVAVSRKLHVLPNGIDETLLSGRKGPSHPERLLIGHFGTIYGRRTTYQFLKGVASWVKEDGVDINRLSLVFYGDSAEDVGSIAEQFGLTQIVQVHPAVPRSAVTPIMESCAVLLLLAQQQPLQIPGKVYEYLATGKPVIAMTEHDSATARLLQDMPLCYVAQSAQDVSEIMQVLWQQYTSGTGLFVDRSDHLAPFRYARLTEALADLVKEAILHHEGEKR